MTLPEGYCLNDDNDLAFVFLGGFVGLAPNFGVWKACYEASKIGFRPPGYTVASSAGNFTNIIGAQWDWRKFTSASEVELAEKIIFSLKRKQFASIHPQLKKRLITEFIATLLIHFPARQVSELLAKRRYPDWLIKSIRYGLPTLFTLGAGYTEEKMLVELFKTPSLLVYDNLKHLLTSTISADKVFESAIKIEIPVVNMNKAGWSFNTVMEPEPHLQGWSVFNNFESKFVNMERSARNNKLIDWGIHGARVFGFFNAGIDENGDYLTDSAALSNIPIQFAVRRGYSNIVVFVYDRTNEGAVNGKFNMLVKALPRNFDIVVSQNTRKVIRGYIRVNRDLELLAEQKKAVDELAAYFSYYPENQFSKQRKAINQILEIQKNYSFTDKKWINFMFVGSDPLPQAHFSDFKKEDIKLGVAIGQKVFWDNVFKIEEMRKNQLTV